MGMRMSAIDTFRYLVAGTYYDFLKLDTRIVDDTSLLTRLYDHFVHHYMYEKWKAEIREPGGIQSTSERNKHSQARLRLNTSRRDFLKFMETSEGIKLMFPEKAKATSDDESTPTGVRARGRAERSQDADRLVRAVDALLIQNLRDDGKTQIAKSREKRVVPPFGQRSPSIFSEVPKGMPIQYYDPDWYNNRPPQARAKLQAKLVVVFVPGSSDFFSSRSDNVKLSVEELTQKYGEQVFSLYDTDFKELRAPTRAAAARLAAAGSDDDGESIGSQDTADGDDDEQLRSADEGFITDDEMAADDEDYEEGSDAGGELDDITEGAEGDLAEDVSGSEDSDDVESTQVGGYLDEDAPMEDAALDAQNRADFASAFDTGSRAMTLEEEIFGGPNDDSD